MIGLRHEVGHTRAGPVHPTIEREQADLKVFIEKQVRFYNIDLIGEEAGGSPTIAREVAGRCGCTYVDLDIPLDVQKQIEQKHPPAHDQNFLDEYIFAWNLVREWHMYSKFRGHLSGRKAAMLICGRVHLPAFVKLCSEEGHQVIPFCRLTEAFEDNYDCCKRTAMQEAGVPALNLPTKNPHIKGRFEAFCVQEKRKL